MPESAETAELGVAACSQLLSLGWRLGGPEEEAAAIFEEGRRLAERSGNLRALGALTANYAALRGLGVSANEYVAYCLDAARIADQTGDQALQLAVSAYLSYARRFVGDLRGDLDGCDAALARFPPDPSLGVEIAGFSPYIGLLLGKGWLLVDAGPLGEARAYLERAVELARAHGQHEMLVWFELLAVQLCDRRGGDAGAALQHGHRALETAETLGAPSGRVMARLALGTAQLLDARADEAVATLEEGLRITRETRAQRVYEGQVLAVLARAFLARGEIARARVTAEEGIAAARTRGTRVYEVYALLALAQALLSGEGSESGAEVEDVLGRAQALIRECGAAALQADIHGCRAELARRRGDEVTRQRELRQAHRLFTEMGATGHAERIAKELS